MSKAHTTQKEYNWLYIVLLFIGMAFFYSLYLNKAFPASEGWHFSYQELMSQGLFPYRDFYYYLPPLDLFITNILWKLSMDSFLIYRIWRLIERILIVEIMYAILRRYTKKSYAFLACLTGGILYSSCVYDLLGDYNQTGLLMIALMALFLHLFACADTRKKKKIWALLIGVCLGLCFLSKQTYFIACFLVLSLAILIYGIIRKDRLALFYYIIAGFGTLLPVIACLVWLAFNQALMPFIDQVFLNVDSKGGMFEILVMSVVRLFWDGHTLPVIITASLGILYHWNKERIKKRYKVADIWYKCIDVAWPLLLLVLFYSLKSSHYLSFYSMISSHNITALFVLFGYPIVCGITIMRIEYKGKRIIQQEHRDIYAVLLCITSITITVIIVYFDYKYIASNIYENQDVYDNFRIIFQRAMDAFLAFIMIYEAYRQYKNEKEDRWGFFFIIFISFASLYSQKMAAGKSLATSYYLIIAAPVIIIWGLNKDCKHVKLKNILIITLCEMCILIVGSQKSISSYSWWGWKETPVRDHIETIALEPLKGFKVTKKTRIMYEEITKVIQENSTEDSEILGYPHLKIFNLLTNRNKSRYFVPVLFYDVVSSKFVSEQVKSIISNPPDIIVWQDIPYCYDAHVNVFREDGKLAQREFEIWFAKNRNELYELVGKVDNVFVYKLRGNGIEVKYKYIEDDQENNTASMIYRFFDDGERLELEETEKHQFKGKGTESDPFLIETADDLCMLAKSVNKGCLFNEMYFMQTNNIDLSEIEPWIQIGKYGGGCYFCGIYDGGGFMITGIRCDESMLDGYSGLFGELSGKVCNLTIRDSYFSGKIAGGIATTSHLNASIENCTVQNTKIRAGYIAGGIAGDFPDGSILNCYSSADVLIHKNSMKQLAEKYGIEQQGEYNGNVDTNAYGITKTVNHYENCFSKNRSPFQFKAWSKAALVRSDDKLYKIAEIMNEYIMKNGRIELCLWDNENGSFVFR